MKISMDKKYQNRKGETVKILKTDVKCDVYPIAGLVSHHDGYESVQTYSADGMYFADLGECADDLVEVLPLRSWRISYDPA